MLKDIAFKIIDFISQFEDELVKIWNKPKFVLNSNYVISLDRIAERPGGVELLERLLTHPKIEDQIQEWIELGIVDEGFEIDEIFETYSEEKLPLFDKRQALKKGFITTGFHIPYKPELTAKARELRKNMTPAEKKLWYKFLRGYHYRFLRQKPIDRYIVDFYCPQLLLVIEIDGETHYTEEGKIYDEERTSVLESYGLRIIRFTNKEVLNNFEGACQEIEKFISSIPERSTSVLHEKNNATSLSTFEGTNPPLSPLNKGGQRGVKKQYLHLPVDTKYFKDLEVEILGLFDDLDNSLDGWLIKSENYQALNTILPKFKEKVQTIYIDPPFNKEQDADYFYSVKYKDASWITLLENRLRLAKDVLNERGSIFVRCDYNGNWLVRPLMNRIFEGENFRNEIVINKSVRMKTEGKKFPSWHDSIFWYSKNIEKVYFHHITEEREKEEWRSIDMEGEKWDIIPKDMIQLFSPENIKFDENGNPVSRARIILGKEVLPRSGRRFPPQEVINELEKQNKIRFSKNGNPQMLKPQQIYLSDDWTGFYGYSFNWDFSTENSEILLKRIIESTSGESDLIMDFFLGIGTATAVAHKLKRKWIGIEMGEHFYRYDTDKGPSGVLVRMKEVLAGRGNHEPCGISKEVNWQGGGFFKYYELEQYEDTLRKVKYEDSDLFDNPYQDPYNQYVFMKDLKMLESLEVDYENNKVKVDLSKLYPNIDIPETLSNLLGKWIKKLKTENSKVKSVVFEDGEEVDIENLDYKLIKPLIWW